LSANFFSNNETPATIAYPIAAPQGLMEVLEDGKQVIFYVFGYLQSPENPKVEHIMEGTIRVHAIN